jgi:hypothetical protein
MSAVAKRDDNSVDSAIITFRGQPLTDTPVKAINSPFVSNSRLPVRKNKLLSVLPSSNGATVPTYKNDNTKASRNDKGGENEDDSLTRENTKANTGYKTIKLQTVRVQMTTPKPPSPSSHFRKDTTGGLKKLLTTVKSINRPEADSRDDEFLSSPSPPINRSRRVKFIKQIDESSKEEIVREIPYYDTTIPLTSCLRKEPSIAILKNRSSEDEDLIVVKKLVYPPSPIKSRKKK